MTQDEWVRSILDGWQPTAEQVAATHTIVRDYRASQEEAA